MAKSFPLNLSKPAKFPKVAMQFWNLLACFLKVITLVGPRKADNELICSGFSSKKVADYDFISGISIGCRYYRNWTNLITYRDGDCNA